MNETRIFTGQETVRQAESRIRSFVRETALEAAPILESGEGSVFLKLENQQLTGSFKIRGALNRILTMTDDERAAGIVTASAGNHALGVAYAAEQHGVSATIFVPTTVDAVRKREIERYSVELRLVGDDYSQTEDYAIDTAKKTGRTYVSPYNDPDVIAGQGTIAIELLRQLPSLETIIVAVGGGGLVSGIGSYLKAVKPEVKVVGVSPSLSPAMFDLLADTPEEFQVIGETLSDSTSGLIQKGSMTIDLCRAVVDQWVLVEEQEIIGAMNYLFHEHRLVVEGAGALSVAAYLKEQDRYKDSNTVALVCGGNIETRRFLSVI